MSASSLSTDVVFSRFSYYKLEQESNFLACAKMVAYAVANIFIHIGNFFYECLFPKKEVEVSLIDPSKTLEIAEQENEPSKKSNKKVRCTEPLDPNIAEPRTWKKKNKQGKVVTVCDQGTYLPCVSEPPLKKSMEILKKEGRDLECAIQDYSQAVDAILPIDNLSANFSPEDVALLKHYKLSKRIEGYVARFEARNKRKPTQEEFNNVFTQQNIEQIHAHTESLLKALDKVEEFKRILEALKAPKSSPLINGMIMTLGLLAGAASIYCGSQLGSYLGDAGSEAILSIANYNQNIVTASLGTCLLTGLHGLAFLRRGYNWGKMALIGSTIAAKMLMPSPGESTVSLKTLGKAGGALAGSYIAVPVLYNGMKEYYENREFAIGNESKYAIRDYLGVSLMDKVKDYSLNFLSQKIKKDEREIETSSRKSFEKTYEFGKKISMIGLFATTVFGLGTFTAVPLAAIYAGIAINQGL